MLRPEVLIHCILNATIFLAGCGREPAEPAREISQSAVGKADAESETGNAPLAVSQQQDDPKLNWEHGEFARTPAGEVIELYTLSNGSGMQVRLLSWGASIAAVEVPDKNGAIANVVLNYSTPEQWLENPVYFGCTVGRYANRIAGGVFGLNGNIYTLARNDGQNHLHGGTQGFHRANYDAEAESDESAVWVTFRRLSPDGEDGYPGSLTLSVTYRLTEENELDISYEATTDKPTVVNLTNHSYWNLTGSASDRNILNHRLKLDADVYLPVNDELIPTGDMAAVADTALDFSEGRSIGAQINAVKGGYDHCYVINRQLDGLALAATLEEPDSGRIMSVSTTEPGIQVYTGNFLDGSPASGGFGKHHGICLETQHFPDSPNQPHFPATTLLPGQRYQSRTVYRFSVAD